MSVQIQLRRDTAANWTSVNPTLALAEVGYETDTGKHKVGNGSTAWVSLAYSNADLHIVDSSAAHAASAISADSTTLVGTGTNVQAVLEELDNGIADHLADTSAAHAASAISFAPNGSIAATDVQAAIQEVRDEAGGGGAPTDAQYLVAAGHAGLSAEVVVTAAGLALLDDADAAAQRTTLGLAIGTNVQAYDAELAAIAGLTSAADTIPGFTGSGTASLVTMTAAGRALVDDADAAAMRATLGLGYVPVFARKTADESFSVTALANSAGLGLTVPGSGTYIFEYNIFFSTNAQTVGIRLSANGPTVSAVTFGVTLPTSGTNGGAGSVMGSMYETAWDGQTVPWTGGPGANGGVAIMNGSFVATASGTLNLRHGSETATATTIFLGSYGILTRIA